MTVRVKHHGRDIPLNRPEMTDPVVVETTVDGQTFAWMPGQTRNFLDDSVGQRHAGFTGASNNEDNIPFGNPRA